MTLLNVVLAILGLAFLSGIVRAGIGPTLADRAAAADLCLFSVVAALAVLAVRLEQPRFIDAVVAATLLGFVATVALARLVGRRS